MLAASGFVVAERYVLAPRNILIMNLVRKITIVTYLLAPFHPHSSSRPHLFWLLKSLGYTWTRLCHVAVVDLT